MRTIVIIAIRKGNPNSQTGNYSHRDDPCKNQALEMRLEMG